MPGPIVTNEQLDAVLILSHGDFFLGKGIGILGQTEGEICFNTGLTGYQETITDPSFAGQLITFTFPHIGNVGTTPVDMESTRPFCRGIIIREAITAPSNFRSHAPLQDFLKDTQLTGISGVDTRELTRIIRTKGACHAAIHYVGPGQTLDINTLHEQIKNHPDLSGQELTGDVTTKITYNWTSPTLDFTVKASPSPLLTIVAFDFGIKHHILRLLVDTGFKVIVVPATTSYDEVMAYCPDGIFLSNGPGDPHETGKFVTPVIQAFMAAQIPIFGICLGHQLLGIAAGLSTTKMHQGHRGANQPVQELTTGRVLITSQNHGFCIITDQLPSTVEVTHTSLFDGSNEGIRLTNCPAFSVQFHPESSPGPHDTRYLFDQFRTLIETTTSQRNSTHA